MTRERIEWVPSESEEILAVITDAVFRVDRQWRFTYLNPQAERTLERPKEQLLGRVLWEEFPEAVGRKFERYYHRAMREGVPVTFEEWYPSLGKAYDVRAYPSEDGLVVFFVDVTERKRTEEALRSSEERYRALFESVDVGFCVLELVVEGDRVVDFVYEEVNPAFGRHTGMTDVAGRRVLELLPDLERRWFDAYEAVYRSGQNVRFVEKSDALDGRWFSVNAIPMGDRGSRRLGVLFADITERARNEAALRSAEERLRLALEAGELGVWELDLVTRRSERRSRLHDAIFGYPDGLEEWGFGPFLEHVHPEDREGVVTAFTRALEEGDTWEFRCRIVRPDGLVRSIWVRGIVNRDEGGTPVRAVGVVQDVTERIEMKRAVDLLEVERLLSEGLESERRRIARELHDTVRQQLVGMRMLITGVQKRVRGLSPADARLLEDFADILTDTNLQVRELIHGLVPQRVGASNLLAALQREARAAEQMYGVSCEATLPEELPEVPDDVANHLFYIAREALTNAAKHARATRVSLVLRVTERSTVVQVFDDGEGLPDGFEESGGIGVQGMRQRATLIGAEFRMESRASEGTVVTCVLPRA